MEQISRNRETFMDRISNKDESTKEGYYFVIDNFENFCMVRKNSKTMKANNETRISTLSK